MRHGFSLVELSIVLVILGLLTGGILAGQSLIRASELRAVSTEISRYQTAVYTFRDKYFALPGDMNNAQSFWGADSVSCPNGGGATGTCNGNGDGVIGTGFISQNCETQEYWRQLALAGLVEGNYRPNTAASCYAQLTAGVELPRLRINNGAATMSWVGTIVASGAFPGNVFYPGSYQNALMVGLSNSSVNHLTIGMMLSPEEAWNIDTKTDDGRPGIGKVVTILPSYNGGACANGDTTAADYSLNLTGARCPLVFKAGF